MIAPPTATETAYADTRRAFVGGVGAGLRMPVLMVTASMVGWGSLARDTGLSLAMSVVSTLGVWGLPGQVAMAEMFALGAPVAAVLIASSMANLRFLPMALTMIPLFRGDPVGWRWRYLVVQVMSINIWAVTMQRAPLLPTGQRFPFCMGVGVICLSGGVVGTVAGFVMSGAMPLHVSVSLVFLNPAYFAFMFSSVRQRNCIIAVLIGAALGPLAHLASPDWGLPLVGLVSGTAAFYLDRLGGPGKGGGDDG